MTFKDASSPAVKAAAVTPNDSVVFDPPSKAIYVGGSGDLTVVLADDTNPVTFTSVQGGLPYPLMVKKVMLTGTTATGLVMLY
ncbi:spike base protein, RCAP_Rcc01079 family [Cupriavidus basilensis]